MSRPAEPLLAALTAALCGYEFFALTTRRVPPVSRGMWRLPWWKRLLVWLGIIAIGTDHFFYRRFV